MDFTQALDTSMDDFEAPKALPEGSYIFAVTKAHKQDEVGSENKWDRMSFPVKVIEPTEDVDPDDLEEFGKVADTPMSVVFMFTKNPEEQEKWNQSMDRLKKFLYRTLQVDVAEDATLREALAAAVNCQFIGQVKHRPDPNDDSVIYAEIGKTAPLD